MRGKRSKQYRKLMQQYGMSFGFREPYQVLIDAHMIQDAERFKMDLLGGLERTLGGKIKPMITQCSIRHLYELSDTPQPLKDALILSAKAMERRRCNHHNLENPLSTLECLSSVIDPKGARTNKHCYVVASQDDEVRRHCRSIKGVPLVYVKRSVMVMEPMAQGSVGVREGIEREKFRHGLREKVAELGKRKREDDEDASGEGLKEDEGEERATKKKKARRPRGPNPLSVRKPKKPSETQTKTQRDSSTAQAQVPGNFQVAGDGLNHIAQSESNTIREDSTGKKKRRRPRMSRAEAAIRRANKSTELEQPLKLLDI